jgi:hypothetical protein
MSEFLKSLVRSEGKSCEGKLKFPRVDSAERSANDMMVKKAKQGKTEVFEHYKCSFCDGWHVGHQTNFDWIPATHQHHRLMINHYKCQTCAFDWLTSTVFSTRILTHFPGVQDEEERCLLCPKCKNNKAYQGGEQPMAILWMGRKWVNLELIARDSTDTLRTLWDSNLSVERAPV